MPRWHDESSDDVSCIFGLHTSVWWVSSIWCQSRQIFKEAAGAEAIIQIVSRWGGRLGHSNGERVRA
ncbi:hypothetical protein F442_19764 [Phytophthora nicotianae P10297]|uniref:Uncharacterized protein n=3 Tax=Phytophthora nicotianae TaxID=4792 RepID=V9E4Y3_PHYNI|nr:hypothetical protein F443_19962 [Phytophthora nicotianae P1569]ETO62105.1 hypothetical protein F444_19953 [Phytophthora nicotianae P1976]ETP31362.1 hypothetical protein F442_19764 [Phytophthora nicotianae P10297]